MTNPSPSVGQVQAETTVRLSLPWPHKDLSPNARVHWAVKARRASIYRQVSYFRTLEAPGRRKVAMGPGNALGMTFCPPDARRRDLDNLIASMKSAQDGIASALGIDDSNFTTTYTIGEPVKGGAVHVTIARAG
jgi:crossover junction endodeoxyribonuclease RusA